MKVITKQTLLFRVQGQKDYILRPSQHPVEAPEYIRDTHLFKLAIADGTVQEFIPVPAIPPVDEAAKKAAEEKAAADAKAQADAEAAKKADEDKAAEAKEAPAKKGK